MTSLAALSRVAFLLLSLSLTLAPLRAAQNPAPSSKDPQTGTPKAEDPAEMIERTTWSGCLQAGSAASTFRLNLDPGTAVAGPADPASLGTPFVQLIGDASRLKFSSYVGKRVQVKGRELTPEEAVREAARRPDQQEAAETAAGTGGRPQRHLRYVRVEAIKSLSDVCR